VAPYPERTLHGSEAQRLLSATSKTRSIEAMDPTADRILGTELPDTVRFVGTDTGLAPRWRDGRAAPAVPDLQSCVACGLCLPHCPTYRLSGEETSSPRGRITAMKAVETGLSRPDATFASFMDACLVCRACEDVCPSRVPFGRMMEHAREQIEPQRGPFHRFSRWLGFHWILPHPSMLRAAAALQPIAKPFLPKHVRALLTRSGHPFARLPGTTEPPVGVEVRGTVALLSGCAQDRWFHDVNLATIRVLARGGWRVRVPDGQACCGALAAHNGRLRVARRLARRTNHAFADADVVVVNAAGCSAHMKGYEELEPGTGLPIRDLMEFLDEEDLGSAVGPLEVTVAYHDACHALRAQGIRAQPRALLARIPDLRIVEIPDGDRCCGAAGIYNVTQPTLAGELQRQKAEAVASTGATVVASANPGCSMQLAAGLKLLGRDVEVVHPVELLDRAQRATG
jgi:glycolate oxidase iron-sulfur subunit